MSTSARCLANDQDDVQRIPTMGSERKFPGGWSVLAQEPSGATTGGAACGRCRAPLDLHQPDPAAPDRLLGVCGECGRWHLFSQADSGTIALIVEHPPSDGGEPPPAKPPAGRRR